MRWQYYFENGSKEAVLTALATDQNEDGVLMVYLYSFGPLNGHNLG